MACITYLVWWLTIIIIAWTDWLKKKRRNHIQNVIIEHAHYKQRISDVDNISYRLAIGFTLSQISQLKLSGVETQVHQESEPRANQPPAT